MGFQSGKSITSDRFPSECGCKRFLDLFQDLHKFMNTCEAFLAKVVHGLKIHAMLANPHYFIDISFILTLVISYKGCFPSFREKVSSLTGRAYMYLVPSMSTPYPSLLLGPLRVSRSTLCLAESRWPAHKKLIMIFVIDFRSCFKLLQSVNVY